MYPILEFDPDREAVINPRDHLKSVATTAHCVICFFHDIVDRMVERLEPTKSAGLSTEAGVFPIYEASWGEKTVAFYLAGVGAPLSAALFEEAIARGYRKFVACGSAGVIDRSIGSGHVVVPTAAIRDEGTSYHYLEPASLVGGQDGPIETTCAFLGEKGVPYTTGTTWTTDAFYRETRARVAKRKEQGAITVEMETAALFAVAQFRGVEFAQLLYGGDDVGGESWDRRNWKLNDDDVRAKLFELAVEVCLRL